MLSKKRTAKQAFDLFCTVRKGKVLPSQVEYLETFKHKAHQIGEHTIQTYHWEGTKGTILLIHGWESNSFHWRNLISKLKQAHFNIIAFDAPAHGYSSGKRLNVPLYAEVLQKLIKTYNPKFLVGHSLGGMTIIYNEYKYKNDGVDKIVTVASPSELHELMAHYRNILQLNKRVMQALDAYILNRFGFHIHEFSTSEYVKTNTVEGLLLHDRGDKVTPYHGSRKVHANWETSKLISTEGLGHSLHQDVVNQHIVDFLNS